MDKTVWVTKVEGEFATTRTVLEGGADAQPAVEPPVPQPPEAVFVGKWRLCGVTCREIKAGTLFHDGPHGQYRTVLTNTEFTAFWQLEREGEGS